MARIHNTKNFTVDMNEKIMSSDMSIIRDFTRIYPDACDEGFILESHVTGKQSVWYVNDYFKNQDNDVTHWELLPTSETVYKFPKLSNWKVYIWNT